MAAIILQDKWRRQPSGPAVLAPEWAKGARFVVSAGSGRVNLANGLPSIPGSRGISPSIGGLGLDYSSTADTPTNTGIDSFESSVNVTIFSCFIVRTAVAWSACIYDRNGWNGGTFGDDGLSYRYVWDGSEWSYSTGLTFGTNRVVAAAHSISANSAICAVDGRTDTRSVSNSARGFQNFANWFGSDPNGGRNLNGVILLAGICVGESWSGPRLQEWTKNPWQIFRKQPRILYFPSAGGGGATYNETVSETLAAVAASSTLADWLGTASETAAVTTAQAAIWSGSASLDVALTLATTQAQDSAVVMTVAETLTVTDARDAIGSWHVDATFSLVAQGAESSVATFSTTTSETIAATSAQDFDGAQVSMVAETVAATSSEAVAHSFTSVISETAGIIDARDGTASLLATISETLTANVAQFVVATAVEAALSEALSAQDQVTVLVTLDGVVSVAVGLNDAALGILSTSGAVEFTAGFAEAVAAQLAAVLLVNESSVIVTQEAGDKFAVSVGLPSGRTLTIRFQSRTLVVQAEGRTFTVH